MMNVISGSQPLGGVNSFRGLAPSCSALAEMTGDESQSSLMEMKASPPRQLMGPASQRAGSLMNFLNKDEDDEEGVAWWLERLEDVRGRRRQEMADRYEQMLVSGLGWTK